MNFFTFCNFINRISTSDLEEALYMLMSSIKKFIPKYELICFVNYNFNFERFKDFNVKFTKYYDNGTLSMYHKHKHPVRDGVLWRNMSINKIS